MSPTVRHALIITGWELGELVRERAMMALAALFTIALPVYLAWMSWSSNVNPDFISFWALESAFAPIFLASMMMVHTFISDRDQGILPTLLATPISNLALFVGKALPIIVLGVVQGCCGSAIFILALWLHRPNLLATADRFALLLVPPVVVCTTLVVCGLGIIVASHVRSPRSASLVLTFCALGVLICEYTLALYLMITPVGRLLAPEAVVAQGALGIALLVVAANTYQRERILAQL